MNGEKRKLLLSTLPGENGKSVERFLFMHIFSNFQNYLVQIVGGVDAIRRQIRTVKEMNGWGICGNSLLKGVVGIGSREKKGKEEGRGYWE